MFAQGRKISQRFEDESLGVRQMVVEGSSN